MTLLNLEKILGVTNIKPEILLKAVGKVVPKFIPFISQASAAGYAGVQILDFLRGKIGSKGKREKERIGELQERENAGNIRPDERATISLNRQRNEGIDILKRGAGLAASLGGATLAKHLATKGASELQKAAESESAASSKEAPPTEVPATDFTPRDRVLKAAPEQLPKEQKHQLQPQAAQSINPLNQIQELIAQFPELGRFIDQQMSQGVSPREAALAARKKHLLVPIIKRIEGTIGIPFVDAIEQLFSGQRSQGNSEKGQDPIEQSLVELIQKIRGK